MRFAALLLLATAVSSVRITQRATVQVEEPTKEEILKKIKEDPKAALKFVVDMIYKKCDGNGDGTLTVDEAKACVKKAEEELPEEAKDEFPEMDDEDKAHLAKIAKDGVITKEELAETIKGAWEKYGPKE